MCNTVFWMPMKALYSDVKLMMYYKGQYYSLKSINQNPNITHKIDRIDLLWTRQRLIMINIWLFVDEG